MSLFDEILKKNSKKNGVDIKLVHKIISEQQKEDGDEMPEQRSRQKRIENIIKDSME